MAKLISPAIAKGERAASATIRLGVVAAWTCTTMPFKIFSRHLGLERHARNGPIGARIRGVLSLAS
jgi:hypothetical protein